MKVLHRYIAAQFSATVGLAVAVLTFVMLSANLMRAFELLGRGVPGSAILLFILYMVPLLLTYTLPLGVLCGAVMVFSRLAADSEITAMRASGVSLWQILSPCLGLTLVLCAGCLALQVWIAPLCHERADRLKHGTALTNPTALLTPGSQIKAPGCLLYVEEIDDDTLRHVQIYTLDEHDEVREDIHAARGQLLQADDEGNLTLVLENAVVASRADQGRGALDRIQTPELRIELDLSALIGPKRLARDPEYLQLPSLFAAIDVVRDRGRNAMPLYVELHTRLSLALAPLGFLLIGIPCGIRTHRSETSIGMVVSLGLTVLFYAFVVLADNLKETPAAHPDLIVWLPTLAYQIAGLLGLHYIAAR